MRKHIVVLFIPIFIFTSFIRINTDEVVNYYGLPDVLIFNNQNYKLTWSSHPTDIYYKHEYIPKGEVVEHFNNMIMIDFLQTNLSAKDVMQAQVDKINERKKTDVVCNYQLIESPDGNEFILDFLMSESKNNQIDLLEWNGYHYKSYTDKLGHKGVLLFAISHRAYGDQTATMLHDLSNYRNGQIKALIAYPVPEIQLKK